jgi:hypothetical protein
MRFVKIMYKNLTTIGRPDSPLPAVRQSIIDATVITDTDKARMFIGLLSKPETEIREIPFVRNAVVKFIYSATLIGMKSAQMLEFWQHHPLNLNGNDLTQQEMFSHFWNSRAKTSLFYCSEVLHDLDWFCIAHGYDHRILLENALKARLFLDAGEWLHTANAIPELAAWNDDLASIVIQVLDHLFGQMSPSLRLEKKGYGYADSASLHLFSLSFKEPGIMPLDFETIIGPILQYLPYRFSLPSYEAVVCFAEMQPVNERIQNCATATQSCAESLINNGYGHWESFAAFAKRNGFKTVTDALSNKTVFVADRDWVCPARKRNVLEKNKAYGTPAYLFSITHKPRIGQGNALMRCLDREINYQRRTAYHQVARLHRELLNSLQKPRTFTFSGKTESICFREKFITSGAQARLLKEILRLHLLTGKTMFERKELTAKDDLICSPYNTGFAVRLARIQRLLTQSDSPVRIVKKGRGRFLLKSSDRFGLIVE